AFGLDSPASVVEILKKLKSAGYKVDHIPETGNQVIEELMQSLTNDSSWLSGEEMEKRSEGEVPEEMYNEWFSHVPVKPAEMICRDWGQPPGELFVTGKKSLLIPGVMNGNVFIGIQPPRGYFEQIERIYHSVDLVMPHHYLAYYRWLKHEFGAHALIHLGTHGTLEWLPGKSVGLSENCFPDLILDDIPHFYPYIMNNPGEGIQAKRRSVAAILDHLIPAMMRADGYDEVADLDSMLQEYFRSRAAGQGAKSADILDEILSLVNSKKFYTDLGFEDEMDVNELKENAERLYDYISEVKDGLIKDGLHIFGIPPADQRFFEMVYALTRLDNGRTKSLRKTVADRRGYDLYDLIEHSSDIDGKTGECKGALLERLDLEAQEIIRSLESHNFDPENSDSTIESLYPDDNSVVKQTARFICSEIVTALRRTTDETDNLVRGLGGGYIPPGPSGPPTRGNAHLLPTGRNFYSIDPATIPTPAAWRTGQKLADQMVKKYIDEKGCYPENVGIVVFATDTMKSGGDDIAYVLNLMGLRPVWSDRGGAVTALEVIPLKELGRPRIDVTLRISGLFRDVFPMLMHMIDEGVEMIATLDESSETNYLAMHMRRDILDKIKGGLPEEEARRLSLIRIFGCPPGNYGAGVSTVVSASAWDTRRDIADVYANWGAHAYGRNLKGERCEELFRERFGQLDVTVKNHVSRELDILDHDDDFMYLGGMNACTKVYGGKDPFSVIGDASDPDLVKTRTVPEEIRFLFRSRVLNPKWLEGLKPHGYRGVQELVANLEYTFGWDVTSDAVDDWEYQELAEHFLFNKETREWIEENNPHALQNMAKRLLEALERGFWDADEETIERLKEIYLESEEMLERMTE
ncbi:MAG: cobaltochelatase subunit CobN, partial [Methanospirillum sp.]|nr:cobaltochelatase subunit CobN [Methanospirillum sp.]